MGRVLRPWDTGRSVASPRPCPAAGPARHATERLDVAASPLVTATHEKWPSRHGAATLSATRTAWQCRTTPAVEAAGSMSGPFDPHLRARVLATPLTSLCLLMVLC
jgi:hypothetical protein